MAKEKTQAQLLVELGNELFDLRVNESGQVVGIPKDGPRIARPLKGQGSVQSSLVARFYQRFAKPPSTTALMGAVSVLESGAGNQRPVRTPLRLARMADRLVIDMGDPEGRVILVGDGRWGLAAQAPEDVCFRRTSMTGALPTPRRGGDVDLLRRVINVRTEDWPLIVAWLTCALLDVQTPILALLGQQGSGKSFAGRVLVSTVDPGLAPLRAMPHRPDDWAVTASGSHAFGLDNVSRIKPDMSDALCRAVTGEGYAKRSLYSNDDIHVLTYQRAMLLTSIDPGALQGDLGERLIPVELRAIAPKRRRKESELRAQAERIAPRVFGALLDLAAYVLANPVELDEVPRMADAAHVMAALDAKRGTDTLDAYKRSAEIVINTVLESDPLAAAVVRLMQGRDQWRGTATSLLADLTAVAVSDSFGRISNWPANAKLLSERLARMAPALRDGPGLLVRRRRTTDRQIVLKWAEGARRRGAITSSTVKVRTHAR